MTIRLHELWRAIEETPLPPCESGLLPCKHWEFCATAKAACNDFKNYINQGCGIKPLIPGRQPLIARYDSMFNDGWK